MKFETLKRDEIKTRRNLSGERKMAVKKEMIESKRQDTFSQLIARNKELGERARKLSGIVRAYDIDSPYIGLNGIPESDISHTGRIEIGADAWFRLHIYRKEYLSDQLSEIGSVSTYTDEYINNLARDSSTGMTFSPVSAIGRVFKRREIARRLNSVEETMDMFMQAAMDPNLNPELAKKFEEQPLEAQVA